MIYWSQFDWPSFSTLAAGLAAVIGALILGRRQLEISKQQLSLMQNQENNAELARLREHNISLQTLQTSLLDKRMEFIREFRGISDAYMTEDTLSDEEWRKLVTLFQSAQLLYPVHIAERLETAAHNIFLYKLHEKRSRFFHDQGRDDEARKRLENAFDAEDVTTQAMHSLLDLIIASSRIIDPTFDRPTAPTST